VPILSCQQRVAAKAHVSGDKVMVDITDLDLVGRIRDSRPTVLMRQLFEPGGRFRVDETGVKTP
jgi:hypothetical protein